MRIVLSGAGSLAVATARLFIEHNHEVVIIEKDEQKVERLSETLDCSFVVGDASKPAILADVGPKNTDFLFCLTEDDQDNIIASLVGRSLGFGRVITSIKDTDYEPICSELGLDGVIFLDRTIAQHFSDMVQGIETAGLSAALKGGLRFFAFRVTADRVGKLSELALPESARAVALTRDDTSWVAHDDFDLKQGDEVLVVAGEDELQKLHDEFAPEERYNKTAEEAGR